MSCEVAKYRLLYFWWAIWNRGDSGLWSSIYGRFIVLYPDGGITKNMYYNFACNYANVYGGEIIYVGKKVYK